MRNDGRPFAAADVRRMLSDPVYAYRINLLPAERVTKAEGLAPRHGAVPPGWRSSEPIGIRFARNTPSQPG
jgi:hypothetical protein